MANKTMHHAVIGADTFELIDEAGREETSQLKNALIVSNASGSIASFPDGGGGFPVRDLKVQFEPIQDLHGQSSPYPPGGGKNKLNTDIENLKTLNTIGTWNGNAYTHNGLTFTVADDGKITVNGTASTTTYFELGNFETGSETYKLNGWNGSYSASFMLVGIGGTTWYSVQNADGRELPQSSTVRTCIYVASDQVASNSVFSPMIRLASVTDATFAPYSNICPISGRSSVTVTRTGVNVWDEEWELGDYAYSGGTPISSTTRIRSKANNFIKVIPNTTYYACTAGNDMELFFYDADKNYVSRHIVKNNNSFATNEAYYIRFSMKSAYGTTYNNDISINYPSTDHDYHAYQGQSIDIQLGQTVYGGTLDVTQGVLTVDRAITTFDGSSDEAWGKVTYGSAAAFAMDIAFSHKWITGNENISTNYLKAISTNATWGNEDNWIASQNDGGIVTGIKSITALADWKAYLANNPLEVCYELLTPITVQLTAQQMTTLLGQNNVWSDADSVSVDYVADTKLYIAKVIADALS